VAYKRNQVEDAIARTLEGSATISTALRTRIKRLLEFDRNLGRKLQSRKAEERNFAFFSEESPGSGADTSFSEYEAFALLNALYILHHGWPQSFAVSTMRRLRSELTKQHARILKQDPNELFNLDRIRANASEGDLAVDNTDPVFVILLSMATQFPDRAQSLPVCGVCRGLQAVRKLRRETQATSLTMWEVATVAHRLSEELGKTEARRRGRTSSSSGR
jgi:hypothetical protein